MDRVHGAWTADSASPRWTTDKGHSGASPVHAGDGGEDEPVEAVLGSCSPVTEEWQRGGAPEATNGGGLSSSRG
jgi:hypothetical protein